MEHNTLTPSGGTARQRRWLQTEMSFRAYNDVRLCWDCQEFAVDFIVIKGKAYHADIQVCIDNHARFAGENKSEQ